MKTNQVLQRKMGNFDIFQRTSDGYFDANLLLGQWNKSELRGTKRRQQMSEFTSSPKTKEFIDTISRRESHERKTVQGDFQSIKEVKGRMTKNGKTKDQVWMHPFLFIDFAMWINAEFKYDVIKFVYDQLIQYRNEAGDSYKDMAAAICGIVDKAETVKSIKEIARANNYVIYNNHEALLRNKDADELKMRELCELQRDISKLINQGFIKSFDNLKGYLRKLWCDRWMPKPLSA